jgi:hypothetical protein
MIQMNQVKQQALAEPASGRARTQFKPGQSGNLIARGAARIRLEAKVRPPDLRRV